MEWYQRRVHGGPSQTQKCSRFFSTSRITPVPTARPVTPTSRRPTSSSSPPARTRLPVTPTSRPPPPTPSPSTSKSWNTRLVFSHIDQKKKKKKKKKKKNFLGFDTTA